MAIETDGYFDVTSEAEDAKAQVLARISDLHSQRLEKEQMAAKQAELDAERRRLREEEEAREEERKELEELRRFKVEQEAAKAKREAAEAEAKRQAEEDARKPEPQPEPEPEPLPAAAEHKPIDTSRLSAAVSRASEIEPAETVTITRKEYDRLIKAEAKLAALEAAGVDKWAGFQEAMKKLAA